MANKTSKVTKPDNKLTNLLFAKPKDFVQKLESTQAADKQQIDRKAVWVDEDDEGFDTNGIPNLPKKELYKESLKRKYETLLGTPKWASIDRKKQSDDEGVDDTILRTVGHLKKKKSITLPKDFLEVKRFPKFGLENENKIISCLEFHPTASVALVGSQSGKVTLFSVGGDINNKLHSFKLQRYSLSDAYFTPNGTEAYIASNFKHEYCVYDLMKAEPKLVSLPQAVKRPKIFTLSPDGKYIAVGNGFDEAFLISTNSKELLRILKHNDDIQSITFSSDSDKLYSFCTQGEVYIWNLSTFRVEKKFYDNGCVSGSHIAISPCGRLLATGSGEGIVNVYETSSIEDASPMPLKVIQNLKTKITKLKFNSTSEILSMVSSAYPNAVKLVHIPSYHVFGNFPPQMATEHINSISFSPNSGFMALGNNKGNAMLYRLKHYKNY